MKLRTKLMDIAKAVADHAERDPEFAARLSEIFGADPSPKSDANPKGRPEPTVSARPKNRRPPAVLDPVSVAREGEAVLRERLEALSLEQLRDIVADYATDPRKLVIRWKSTRNVIDHIVEVSASRAAKGDAFRPA